MSSDATSTAPVRRPGSRPFEPQLADRARGVLPMRHTWRFERKYDGIRLLVHVDDDRVVLRTRPGTDRTADFPEVAAAVRALGLTAAVLDAELVAFDRDGRDRFGLLQRQLGHRRSASGTEPVRVRLMVFDLLRLDGRDLRGEPLDRRRARLDQLGIVESSTADGPAGADGPVALAPVLQGDPDDLLERACREGWEGLIAKRADAPYRAGRSSTWRKLVCTEVERFIIGGWTTPGGTRPGLGAVLVGTPTPAGLVYRGRVGSGLDDTTLRQLAAHLQRAELETSPFVDADGGPGSGAGPGGPGVHWCVPHLVVEVRYLGVTDAGRLRQARLIALRPDLAPDAVPDLPSDDRSA
jgi:bifunctional non-homologous end joining protein LigD